MGLIAIGDIHGCARTLDALLEALAPTADDHLVFVGDYTDRGPRSRQVLDRLLALEAASRADGPRCTFLRGNHDQMMLDYVDHGEIHLWRLNGGLTTLASYSDGAGGVDIPPGHVAFLRRTRLYLDTPDFCFVHAGLDPYRTVAANLQSETAETFLWTRDHVGVRDLAWEKPVVCGHTPQHEPKLDGQLLLIDTGCVFDYHPAFGRLTAVRLPEREAVQVPFQE